MSEQRKVPKLRFPEFTDDWEQREFDDFFEYIPHNSLSRDNLNCDEGEVKNIHYGDVLIKFGEVLNPTIEKIPFINKDIKIDGKSCFLQDGDIVIADAAEDLTVGKCTEISNGCNQKLVAGLHTIPCRPKNKIEEGFLGFYLNSKAYHNQLLPLIQGTKVSSISKSSLKETWVTFPFSSNEQKKIGRFFLTLNNLITLHQRKCEVLKKLKKGLLQKIFPKDGTNIPEIRFPEFTDAWERRELSEVAEKVTAKNSKLEFNETFTNSAEQGIISQKDFFDHKVASSDNIGNYYVVEQDDFVYNPRISTTAPVGPINRNRLGRAGVMSPLYTVFKTKGVNVLFLEWYFKSSCWHTFMFFNGDSGARSDRFSIKDSVFFSMPLLLPSLEEQNKVGLFLDSINRTITLHQRE